MFSKLYSLDKNINNPDNYSISKDIVWASPAGFDLTMDIYSPKKDDGPFPVLVIFHGGGFLIRRKNILDNMAQYIASHHDYVVCNVNYRLLGDQHNSVTFNELIGDAFGSILWIKENIFEFKGDKDRLAVTGDSAGAYISAMIVNSGTKIGKKENYSEHLSFEPSYLPEKIKLKDISNNNLLAVNAAVLSYGGFDFYKWALNGAAETYKNLFWWLSFSKPRGIFGSKYNPINHPEMYKASSPIYNIPNVQNQRLPPQLVTSASRDKVVPAYAVKDYVKALQNQGQLVEYWEYKDKGHAYLDSGKSLLVGNDFKKDAIPALKKIMNFLDACFN